MDLDKSCRLGTECYSWKSMKKGPNHIGSVYEPSSVVELTLTAKEYNVEEYFDGECGDNGWN